METISYKVAKLAKEQGFNDPCFFYYGLKEKLTEYVDNYRLDVDHVDEVRLYDFKSDFNSMGVKKYSAPTQAELQKFIREKRGVHIEIHRNASGYYWSMCMEDGGTDLGWSNHSGTNLGGAWDSYELSLENALLVQLTFDLPTDLKIIAHWGNYAHYAMKITNKH